MRLIFFMILVVAYASARPQAPEARIGNVKVEKQLIIELPPESDNANKNEAGRTLLTNPTNLRAENTREILSKIAQVNADLGYKPNPIKTIDHDDSTGSLEYQTLDNDYDYQPRNYDDKIQPVFKPNSTPFQNPILEYLKIVADKEYSNRNNYYDNEDYSSYMHPNIIPSEDNESGQLIRRKITHQQSYFVPNPMMFMHQPEEKKQSRGVIYEDNQQQANRRNDYVSGPYGFVSNPRPFSTNNQKPKDSGTNAHRGSLSRQLTPPPVGDAYSYSSPAMFNSITNLVEYVPETGYYKRKYGQPFRQRQTEEDLQRSSEFTMRFGKDLEQSPSENNFDIVKSIELNQGFNPRSQLSQNRQRKALDFQPIPQNSVPFIILQPNEDILNNNTVEVTETTTQDNYYIDEKENAEEVKKYVVNEEKGVFVSKLKVRKGGIAIAGPGGIATAGNGGTAIVGPNGYAYTQPHGLVIAAPGASVIAIPSHLNLTEIIINAHNMNKENGKQTRTLPPGAKVVATGPIVYYHQSDRK